MFAFLRRLMNRQTQAQDQEDFDFCTCDVCMRELRRAAEKEALEAAAKQQLMPGAFPSDGQDAGKWIKDLTHGITNFPSRRFPSDGPNTDQIHKLLQSHCLYEEELDLIRYRVSSGNVVHFGPGAEVKFVYFPPTTSINITGIPLHPSPPEILKALKDVLLEEPKTLTEDITIADVRRAPNSSHSTVTIHVGDRDPKKIMSQFDRAELFERTVSTRLLTAPYPNQMEDVSPTEKNVVHIYWRAPEMSVAATFKTPASAIAWCEEHDYTIIGGRTVRTRICHSFMSRLRKTVEIRNLPPDTNPQIIKQLLSSAASISFQPRNDYDVERALSRLRKDVETIAADQLRNYRVDESKAPSGWVGIRIQLYTWHAAQRIRDSLTHRRRWYLSRRRLFVTLEEPYRYSISVGPRQYQAQREILHSICDTQRAKTLAGVRIITGAPDQDVRLEVYGSDEPAVGVLKVHVEGVLGGHLIPGCHDLFESNEKLQSVREVSTQTGCFVRFNEATQTITAFGAEDTVQAFTGKLRLYINDTLFPEIELTGPAKSAFYLQRGIPLLASVVGQANVCITAGHPYPVLTVRGGGDEVAHMLQWLHNESTEDVESFVVPPNTACPVCLDHPEARISLECGHIYCYPCLRHFLITGITDKNPVLSCIECLAPISVNTLRKIIPRSDLEDLFELVFNTHVRTNPEKYKFCGTPHCTRLYMLSPKDSVDPPAFHCPSCLRSVCSACQSVPHEGMTCSEWEINQNAEMQKAEALLEKWASRKGKDVHRCPKCNALIEKNKGCNHVRCHCGTHLCWICVQSFPDADSVYTHLRQDH